MTLLPTRPSPAHLPFVAASVLALLVISFESADAQSLRGSAASLDRQNAQARAHAFTYLQTPQQVRDFVRNGYLVPVAPNRDMDIHNVSFPYTRPEVRVFLERLASQYRAACGEKLVVTSLTRPRSNQPPNASSRSVHPTGMAVDLRRSGRAACRQWLESTLMSLERQGVLEAIYERRPPHYHLAVYPQPYTQHLARLTGDANAMAAALGNGPQMESRWVTHRVRRGETLSTIATRYGASTTRLRSENGIRGDRILVGQELRIPVYEVVTTVASGESTPSDAEATGAGENVVAANSPEHPPAAGATNGEAVTPATHTVARGETLWSIARRYGVREEALRRANGLSGSRILAGRELTLPAGIEGAELPETTHTVARGETLWTIARRYGVSEDRVRAANGIQGSRILIGQSLVIPGGSGGSLPVQHTVSRGESLWTIANRHGTTVEQIQTANQIGSSRVYPGQTLSVPVTQ